MKTRWNIFTDVHVPERDRHVSEIVADARTYADHVRRSDIRMKDVRLASQKRQGALTPGLLKDRWEREYTHKRIRG